MGDQESFSEIYEEFIDVLFVAIYIAIAKNSASVLLLDATFCASVQIQTRRSPAVSG